MPKSIVTSIILFIYSTSYLFHFLFTLTCFVESRFSKPLFDISQNNSSKITNQAIREVHNSIPHDLASVLISLKNHFISEVVKHLGLWPFMDTDCTVLPEEVISGPLNVNLLPCYYFRINKRHTSPYLKSGQTNN